MYFHPIRRFTALISVLTFVLVSICQAPSARAKEPKAPTDVFMGLDPDAAMGHQIIMNDLMASAAMKVKDIDRLWNVWEPAEKAEAEIQEKE